MAQDPVHLPQGACRQPDGSVVWRVWAPNSQTPALVLSSSAGRREVAMQPAGFGYFVHGEPRVDEGLRYAFRLDDGQAYPDPASRWQPEGVHCPSAVFSPGAFAWSDADWPGVTRDALVIYELHVGTFTPAGTFDAIIARLADLRELGITAIELMPVAQFPGERNWGYDGVHPFAVQASYGGPRALQRLVDAAHCEGLAVILDVVYNHLGPEGNYLARFGPYFTDRYHTPWGNAVNFDGPDCDPVRQFFIDNACYWVREFHLDGLRLDAVQTIFDLSARHILADIRAAVHREAEQRNRRVHLIGETNQNDIRLIADAARIGHGLDAIWADDFHHCVHALLSGDRDGYYQDYAQPRDLAKAYNEVFVYDGCYSAYRRRRHGAPAGDADRARFVVCAANHDQIGNRAASDRFGTSLAPEAQRLACALLLLSSCTPLVFMGDEYGETQPFPFFCSFENPELIEAVRRGRREEFAALAFRWQGAPLDPQSPATFAAAKLSWQWLDDAARAGLRQLYKALLAARRQWPALNDRRQTLAQLTPDDALLILRRGGSEGVLAAINLRSRRQSAEDIDRGGRVLLLSTEEHRFGGRRKADDPLSPLLPCEVQIFGKP